MVEYFHIIAHIRKSVHLL